ncbi:hypothetical protein QR680_001815 [Steinernema hermaphroditum]|uniref:Uncharacterized protein n=1 Tax=Steinernema hermaphroditum TaxID=289476 RepID=A0AA39LGS3_9BILA|nr:hypothetical protein QR680_001815 [Steinernema hermaphroditum]
MEEQNSDSANVEANPHYLSPRDVKKDCVYRAASLICLILLIVEIVGGSAAGSILLITDGVRLFADYLTHYSTNKNLTPCWRYSEFVLLIACVLFLYALTGVFVFCATQRAMSMEFEIDETLLLVISIIAVLCNLAMLVMHFSKVLKPRRFTPLGDFISLRAHQMLHILFNHGLGLLVFVAAVIIFVDPSLKVIDTIGTYVMAVLVVANTAAIINKLAREIRDVFLKRDSYDQI